MRLFIQLIAVVVGGLGIGGALAWYSIQENIGFGAMNVGVWTAWPLAGSVDADPYTKAKVAADGQVPLGAAEGLALFARTDDAGRPLRANCRYRLRGETPAARYWTLTAQKIDEQQKRGIAESERQLTSDIMVRETGGDLVVEVSPELAGGNWLKTSGDGRFLLTMRLYDTPVTGTRGIVDPLMPKIALLGCGA